MTDLHTHILPGMDDGSQSIDQSLEMLRLEKTQGITQIALTPHFYAGQNSPAQFLQRRQASWEALYPHLEPGLPQLLLGAEVRYFEGICGVSQVMDLRIQGSDYLLLEMPMEPWSSRMLRDIRELNNTPRIQVVLAHIERYLPMQPRQTLDALQQDRVHIQANTDFFLAWRTKRKALKMLENQEIHFLGSDCHNMKNRKPNWDRMPEKAKALLEPSCIF